MPPLAAAPLPQAALEAPGVELHRVDTVSEAVELVEPASQLASRDNVLTEQLEGGFRHTLSAVTVFEVPDFLSNSELVVESHIFSDQHGFAWRLWVKPHDKQDCMGLYLVPAEDLPEAHTADFELAVVGRRGRVWRRELRGGRATLHKRCAGHGWPTFISRAEIEAGEALEDDPKGLLHDGKLIVTASKIANVRPKSDAALPPTNPLARTL